MVFSIEPGVYIINTGGIRIEDLVYLEQGKAKKFISVFFSRFKIIGYCLISTE